MIAKKMSQNRSAQIKDPQDKRSEILHFKTTPCESVEISLIAKKCGMTISSFLRARALGYEPLARLTSEEKDLITKLAQVRSDVANYCNAISGLTSEEKTKLFRNRQLMEKWYNEVVPIAQAVSEFIRDIRNLRMLHPRTTNYYGKEVEK